MREITLTIDGKKVKGKEGDTILDICRTNDIYVPTLCFLEGLSNVGACRMCVVDIQGERRINPACTYPARDGLVVTTSTPGLEKYRRMILELLFTERNHFCMFCAQSGDCELQSLAYRYQMDNVRYPYAFPPLPTDTRSPYIVVDHNRCVLCGRCVRTCREIVGNHTLDFGKRGWRTMVGVDLDQSLGESTCISCGACVQACPTGATFTKVSAYKGRTSECQRVESVCSLCGVGCEMVVLVRDNNLVRIDGANLTGLRGQLCHIGRFDPLREARPRVTSPLKKNSRGEMEECTWEEALGVVADKLVQIKKNSGPGAIAGIASSTCSNGSLRQFARLIREVIGSDKLDTLDGDSYRTIARGIASFGGKGLEVESPLEAILEADAIMVVGADPIESHPVAGCYVLRALQRGTKLVVIDSLRNTYAYRASLWLKPEAGSEGDLIKALANLIVANGLGDAKKANSEFVKALKDYGVKAVSQKTGVKSEDMEQAAELLGKAKRGVILYGERVIGRGDPDLIASLLNLAALTAREASDRLGVISLKPQGNSRGAWELGVASREGFSTRGVKGAYLLLCDDAVDDKVAAQLRGLGGVDFLVVQASYESPLTSIADVVLPSLTCLEREGEYTTLDGRAVRSRQAIKPAEKVWDDQRILTQLAQRLA